MTVSGSSSKALAVFGTKSSKDNNEQASEVDFSIE